ncbi:hypothetical protein [Bifidobacterium ruminantium]|uniref:Uncharacterized protein n=2 Tax=Bifidobacterium ruminantium TaxID=78346 RepID=A0A087CP14_BIFRU|nr:hypothetical protein [Bifidobacterium ruminantium]KFI85014.1 hypothetical protein BRUM_1875 [Bifidobacterium ruminantium]
MDNLKNIILKLYHAHPVLSVIIVVLVIALLPLLFTLANAVLTALLGMALLMTVCYALIRFFANACKPDDLNMDDTAQKQDKNTEK